MDFSPTGAPRDVPLYEAVQAYHKKEFGEKLNIGYYAKVHALVLLEDHKMRTVMGLLGIRNTIDVSIFHVSVLTQELQSFYIGRLEKPGDEARISKAYLPKPNVMAVGHEPEGGKWLLLGDLSDVVQELFVGLARVAGASLGFHDCEHVAACVI